MAAPVIPTQNSPLTPQGNATVDVTTSLTVFNLALLTALVGMQNPELIAEGMSETTNALAYKMPISVGSSVARLLKGGLIYRDLGELMLPVTVLPYGDAVKQKVKVLQSDTWRGWGDQPASMAAAFPLAGERALAKALSTATTSPSVENYVDGDTGNTSIKIIGQDKPVDPLGGVSATYSNQFTGSGDANNQFAAAGMNTADIDRVFGDIKSVLAQNGVDFRDLEIFLVVVPNPQEIQARRYFENQGTANDMVIEQSGSSTAQVAKPNTAKRYGVRVMATPYLPYVAGVTPYYVICRTRTQRKAPWIKITQVPAVAPALIGLIPTGVGSFTGAELEVVIDGIDSHLYKHGKDTDVIKAGEVGIGVTMQVGVAITAPWQIFAVYPT